MLALGDDAWPALVGAGIEGGDGLHLSRAGQAFVARELLAVIDEMGASAARLPMELPLGRDLDPDAFGASMAAHQRKVIAAGSGASPDARRWIMDTALSNALAFALGLSFAFVFSRCMRSGRQARSRGRT